MWCALRSHVMSPEEVRQFFASFQIHLTDGEFRKLMLTFDLDENGNLSYQGFNKHFGKAIHLQDNTEYKGEARAAQTSLFREELLRPNPVRVSTMPRRALALRTLWNGSGWGGWI